MRTKTWTGFFIAGLFFAAASAAAAEDLEARSWAAGCAACHGTGGHSAGGMPSLAGRDADELFRLLAGYRAGQGEPTVMHQHSRGYSEEQLRRIAAFFAAQPR